MLLLLLLLFLGSRLRTPPIAVLLARLVLPSLLLVALGAWKIGADRQSMPSIPDSLALRPVTLSGRVVTPPAEHRQRTRFLLHVSGCFDGNRAYPLEADLAVTVVGSGYGHPLPRVAAEMMIALHGSLTLPGPERNPGEINLKEFLAANGVAATFVVRGGENVRIIEPSGGSWVMQNLVAPARSAVLRIADSTIGGEEGEFLKGLLIGERGGIPPETMQAFVTSGVAHVLAVSGSNVAVVALMLAFLADLLRLPRALRTIMMAAGLLFYMQLSGNQPPVVRATIMALTFLLGRVLQRRPGALNTLGLSALLILAHDARQLFDVGFQLSFCAVFGIIHLYPRADAWISLLHARRWWSRAGAGILRVCAVSLTATLGTLPLTAAWFGRVSVIGVLANIPVVPATGLSVVLGTAGLVGSAFSGWSASAFGALNSVILHWTIECARLAAAVPHASMDAYRFPPSAVVAFIAGVGLVFHWRERGAVRLLLPALLVALNLVVYVPADAPLPGFLRVHCIDVGQGDAVLVEFPGGRTMLIDAGPRSPGFDAGERTVLPYLRRAGISRIDLLVVSHPHQDHLGGVPYLIGHMDVGRIIDSGQPVRSSLYATYLRTSAATARTPEPAAAGIALDLAPEARLYVLSPAVGFVDADTSHAPPNLNNTSVVIRLLYGSVSFLFAADAEEEAEGAMMARYDGFLRSTFLKAGHHGSITSSSPSFLDAVRPEIVAVSVGRGNRFRHPSPVVLQRCASLGAIVARTDRDGAVILESDGHSVRQIQWR